MAILFGTDNYTCIKCNNSEFREHKTFILKKSKDCLVTEKVGYEYVCTKCNQPISRAINIKGE